MTRATEVRALRLIHSVDAAGEWVWFCGHCADQPTLYEAPAPTARVCRACGLGLLLETPLDALPGPSQPFVVIDSAMTVQAMSLKAQELLGVDEELAVNHPVMELLVPADTEAPGAATLSDSIVAALGGEGPLSTFVRPWNTFGLRIRAHVAACGPPRAALLVLEGPLPQIRLLNR